MRLSDNTQLTWTAFKDQWSKKEYGGAWSFEDATLARDNDDRKRLFQRAWAEAGPEICRKYEMKFVEFNELRAQ